MRWRLAYLWLAGPLVFGPSLALWGLLWCSVLQWPDVPRFDAYGLRHLYLPMIAAVSGFVVPWVGLRFCWNAKWKTTLIALASYWFLMVGWGVIDIRHYNDQIGGHDSVGHLHYSHAYLTWYFLPYRWIEP